MDEKIYVVVIAGHKQARWFGSLEKAWAYVDEYGKNRTCSIREYGFLSSTEVKPTPLYKPLWGGE